jgi:hypothetical protein
MWLNSSGNNSILPNNNSKENDLLKRNSTKQVIMMDLDYGISD